MNGLHRVIEEEGLFGGFLHVLVEELLALLEEDQVDFFEIEVRRDHAGSIVPRVGVFGQRFAVNDAGRRNGYSVAVNVSVKPVSRWAGDRSVESVEAAMDRGIGNGARVIDPFDRG